MDWSASKTGPVTLQKNNAIPGIATVFKILSKLLHGLRLAEYWLYLNLNTQPYAHTIQRTAGRI